MIHLRTILPLRDIPQPLRGDLWDCPPAGVFVPSPSQLRLIARQEALYRDLKAFALRHPMPPVVFTADKITVDGVVIKDRGAETEPTIVPFKEVPVGSLFMFEGRQYRKQDSGTAMSVPFNPGACYRTFWPLAKVTVERPKKVEAPKPADDDFTDWIEWKGGECPVAPGAEGEIKLRNGHRARFGGVLREANVYSWTRDQTQSASFEIVAYRLKHAEDLIDSWFPGTVAPARSGVYELEGGSLAAFDAVIGRWAMASFATPRTAACAMGYLRDRLWSGDSYPHERKASHYRWRGYTTPQNGERS